MKDDNRLYELRHGSVFMLTAATLALVACGDSASKGPGKSAEAAADAAPSLQTATVARGEIAKIINATGSVRPEITVNIGSEVSGKILSVNVDFNSVVKAGDVLAVIDPENLENRVAQARAQVDNRRSDININTASLSRAKINAAQAKRSFNRRSQLYAEEAISKAQLEETERALALADADIELAQARLAGAQSSLSQAEADLRSARVNLERTIIKAPIDGVVIERLVDPGQTVAASFSAPELFKIAGDLSKIKVDAAIVESDVSGLDAGDPVTFGVDAYPGQPFEGQIDQLRLKSKNESNIITYTAVVSADNAQGLLMPGMTTNLQITTNSKTDILRIPATAERFRPTPDQIKTWQSDTQDDASEAIDPKTRKRLTDMGLPAARVDAILDRMGSETETLREQIADPTQTWRKIGRQKLLRETYDGIIKKELSSTEYQDYRLRVQADAQIRDAKIWVKDGDKMRQVDVGLGLSDGSFIEVVSGLEPGDNVITGIGGAGGGRKGPPGRRPG